MNILEALAESPKSWTDLLTVMDRIPLDIHLDKLRKQGKIKLNEHGKWEIPKPPCMVEDHLPEFVFKPTGKCLVCGTPVYRKGAKYCGKECLYKGKILPKPSCQRCGNPCKDKGDKYCGPDCRWDRRA